MVEQCGAWAAIKTEHIAMGVQHAQVGDASNVEYADGAGRLAKNTLMKYGDEWGSLAACGNIARAEIGNHIDACELCQ
jgi:hypothetical protein